MFFVVRLVKHHEASWSTSKYSEAYFASQLPSEFGGGSSRDFGLLQSWCFRAMCSPETQRIVQFRVRSVVWWVQCQRCDGKWTANMAEVFPQLWQPFDRWKEKNPRSFGWGPNSWQGGQSSRCAPLLWRCRGGSALFHRLTLRRQSPNRI